MDLKWKHYGGRGLAGQISVYVVFLALWTTITLAAFEGERLDYRARPWRIGVDLAGVLFLLYFVIVEVREIWAAVRRHRAWRAQRCRDIDKELVNVNPAWEDTLFFRNLRDTVESTPMLASYFADSWNYLDWLSYLLLFGAIFTQVYGLVAHHNGGGVSSYGA